MPKLLGVVAAIAMSALAPAASAQSQADGASAAGAVGKPGMSYGSLQDLPDFSGWWGLKTDIATGGSPPPAPPLQRKPAAIMKDWSQKTHGGSDPADIDGLKRSYCGPARFSGFNGGLQDYVEFLFTPGRVTITNEMGLIRRISLDRSLPSDPPETNSGVSVGRWEGRTLVIETVGLNHDTGLGEPRTKLPIKIGRNVHITERISLKEPDVLEILSRTTAPDLFTRPYLTTTLYARDRRHEFQEITNCVTNDRAFDETTGRERFDLTPPADLPPPPK